MKVARYNYHAQFGSDPKPLLDEISEMILQGRYVLTEEVSAFERAFARYLGVAQVCGVNCGNSATIFFSGALSNPKCHASPAKTMR